MFDKYLFNPVLSPKGSEVNASFASVLKENGDHHIFYYYHSRAHGGMRSIGHAVSEDGIKWVRDYENNPILTGSPGGWDKNGASVPVVFKDGSEYYMLYRGQNKSFGHRVGLAMADSLNGPWIKSELNPVISDAQEGWGIIKVGNKYFFYTNNTRGNREIYLWTSHNLLDWEKESDDPIWSEGRFCSFIYKREDIYYALVPHYTKYPDYAEIELYACLNPYFSVDEREYLGVAISYGEDGAWDGHDLDTPFILTDDVYRNSFESTGGELWCYYAGEQGGIWRVGLALAQKEGN